MKIIAVVVTYNRRELLKRNIGCLRQNTPLHSIVVVNNGSTDGTKEWLDEQTDLRVIHQENVGGSGGFYTGIRYAFQEYSPTISGRSTSPIRSHPCIRTN